MFNLRESIVNSSLDINYGKLFFNLKNFIYNNNFLLKLEGLNLAGSIKIKPAIKMIEELEKSGKINSTTNTIIESSSGSLGIALSLVCKVRGYRFICVSDPNINELSKKYYNAP